MGRDVTLLDIELTFALSDAGNAEYFVREADRRLAYDHTDREWFQFMGHHWTKDTVERVIDLAINAMRQRQRDAVLIADSDARKRAMAWALKSENRRPVMDMLALAQANPAIAMGGSEWDANPLLFGVQNGVIDLETGRFRSGLTRSTTSRRWRRSPSTRRRRVLGSSG